MTAPRTKLTLLWIIASLLGVAVSAIAFLILFTTLKINQFEASPDEFIQYSLRFSACAAAQGLILGAIQAALIARYSLTKALRWLVSLPLGMAIGILLSSLLLRSTLLSTESSSTDTLILIQWLAAWAVGGFISGIAITPHRNKISQSILNAIASILYAISVVLTVIFLGAYLDSVSGAATFGLLAGLFGFVPLVVIGSLINSRSLTQLRKQPTSAQLNSP